MNITHFMHRIVGNTGGRVNPRNRASMMGAMKVESSVAACDVKEVIETVGIDVNRARFWDAARVIALGGVTLTFCAKATRSR